MRVIRHATIPVAVLGLAAAVQAPGPTLVLDSPAADSALVGYVRFSARLVPETAKARDVVFYVDGQLACRASDVPYTCEWNAGAGRGTSSVRIVAELVDGQRVVHAVRVTGSAPPGKVFSSGVDAVAVPLQVVDRRGRAVGALRAEQFRLLEDGVAQEIASFTDQRTAAQVLLMLDVSDSMTRALPALKKTVHTFIASLRPQDILAVAGMNHGFFLISPPTTNRPLTGAAVDRLKTQGGTALYDGLIHASTLVRGWPNPRTIVAFTDGEDVSSLSSFDTARAALQRNDVVLFLVAQGKAFEDRALQRQLSRLAEETGGASWFASTMTSLTGHFDEVSRRLSGQYTLTYVPARGLGTGEWRRIVVEVHDQERNVTVLARPGYLALPRRR